ncbi:MAG: tryptorubin family RiPP precursor [Xanthomonas sp.]
MRSRLARCAPARPRSPPSRKGRRHSCGDVAMKLLFAIKHLLSSKKPLKSYAWYIWY